jgi:hypothetical protein
MTRPLGFLHAAHKQRCGLRWLSFCIVNVCKINRGTTLHNRRTRRCRAVAARTGSCGCRAGVDVGVDGGGGGTAPAPAPAPQHHSHTAAHASTHPRHTASRQTLSNLPARCPVSPALKKDLMASGGACDVSQDCRELGVSPLLLQIAVMPARCGVVLTQSRCH